MQNYCKTIGALAAASALAAGTASAGNPTPVTTVAPTQPTSCVEYDLHVGYSSEYLWRGLDKGDDLVEAGFNLKTEYNGIGFSFGAWYGSYDTLGSYEYDVDELDIYGEVSKDFGFLTAAVGYIWYINEDMYDLFPDAQEVYFSLSRDFGFANASLTYFWSVEGNNFGYIGRNDVHGDNDGYSELALKRAFGLAHNLTLNVGTNVGYLVEQGQCTAWTTKIGLDWAFVERAKLTPFAAYSVSLSDDVDTAYYNSDNELTAGAMLSVSF